MDTGSLRGVIIMWVRMTLGIGILTLPNYLKPYGLITGGILIILSGIINYLTYNFIFIASFETGKNTYSGLIKDLLGENFRKIFQLTYMMDILSTLLIYCITSWNLFSFVMHFFGVWDDRSMYSDYETLELHEYDSRIYPFRILLFTVIFIITIPLFLMKNMDSLQPVTIGYLSLLMVLVVWILLELPFIYSSNNQTGVDRRMSYQKPFDIYSWSENISGLLIGYYV